MSPDLRRKWWLLAPAGVAALALFIYIGGEIVRRLWNWLLPPLFGWPELTFWQAFGMLALCRILFGGFGSHGGSHSMGSASKTDRIADRIVDRVADRVAERVAAMSPEERERFRQRLRERLDGDPSAGGAGPAAS